MSISDSAVRKLEGAGVQSAGEPRRSLGLAATTSIVIGNMVGSGVFLLPASLAAYGVYTLWGWVVSTAGALLLARVFSRLSRRAPLAGGPYAYPREVFGDFAGFLLAWMYWVSIAASVAAIAVAFASGQPCRGFTRRKSYRPKLAIARAAAPMFSPSCG